MSSSPADESAAPEIEWEDLAPGGEVSATVLMASGFVLKPEQNVRERYRVARTLGEGAMGQVLAVTLVGSGDAQTYALKVVARPSDDDVDESTGENAAELRKSRQEAQSQARSYAELLRQEAVKQDIVQRHGVQVARLFALVQLDDGSIGMRMELARGVSLESSIRGAREHKSAPPQLARSIAVVRKLMSQLRRLHELVEPGSPFGFVHSDIKPGNVFVDEHDPSDLVVTLLDFGVASAGHAMLADLSTRPSSRGTFVMHETGGTLGYAPPYHFQTRPTPLSDIYAAIVMLYELITLELPWDISEAEAANDWPAIEKVMLGGPRPVRSLRPSISAADGDVLDAFFKSEFEALHELAETASRDLASNDEDAKKSVSEEIMRLAREYQARLDALNTQLALPARPATRPLGAVRAADRTDALPLLKAGDAEGAGSPEAGSSNADYTGALPLVKKVVRRYGDEDADRGEISKEKAIPVWLVATVVSIIVALLGMLVLAVVARTRPPTATETSGQSGR